MRIVSFVLFLSLLLAACSQPEESDVDRIVGLPRNPPTQPAVPWREAAEAISLDTAPQVRLLGRLDNPLNPSTVFEHAFSPDGTLLAGLDNDQIIVWDLVNSETLLAQGRRSEMTRIYFSVDKAEIYVVETNGLVNILDSESGEVLNSFSGIDDFSNAVAYAPDAGWMAFGNRQGEVRIWDPLERSAIVTVQAQPSSINHLAFSPDGEVLALASNRNLEVWDWRNRQQLASFDNEAAILSLAMSPDASLVAAGTSQDIRLWSLPEDGFWHLLETGSRAVEVMIFSPDGRYLLSGGQVPDMQLWDPDSGLLLARLPGVGGDRVSAAFSPDSNLLLTSLLGGGVDLWNLTTITDQTVNKARLDTDDTLIFGVDWSADSYLLTLFGATGSVYLWGVPAA